MLCRIGYGNYDYCNWLQNMKREKWERELKTRARWRISASNVVDIECALGLQKISRCLSKKSENRKQKIWGNLKERCKKTEI